MAFRTCRMTSSGGSQRTSMVLSGLVIDVHIKCGSHLSPYSVDRELHQVLSPRVVHRHPACILQNAKYDDMSSGITMLFYNSFVFNQTKVKSVTKYKAWKRRKIRVLCKSHLTIAPDSRMEYNNCSYGDIYLHV